MFSCDHIVQNAFRFILGSFHQVTTGIGTGTYRGKESQLDKGVMVRSAVCYPLGSMRWGHPATHPPFSIVIMGVNNVSLKTFFV
jgi:hypothetical protein